MSQPERKLKYIALPSPLHISSDPITITATTEDQGHPCRRCLQGAKPNEQVYLISYDPFPSDSVTPYRGDGPIFVHLNDCARFNGDKIPAAQLQRQMSLRAYDKNHMMGDAVVIDGDSEGEGEHFEKTARQMLANNDARYLNVHNAKHGCFAFRVERDE